MGNRAVITTQEDLDSHGIGMYLHWNGGRDSIGPLLDYCRLRGFRGLPDSYGYARMAQVMANFLGGDGLSIGLGPVDGLDKDNYDNGVYVVDEKWRIVGRLYFDGRREQREYDHDGFMRELDGHQPEAQRIGKEMMRGLMAHGRTLPEVASQYHYSMSRRRLDGVKAAGFQTGRTYAPWRGARSCLVEVVAVDGDWLDARVDGEPRRLPRFVWADGCESTVVTDPDGREAVVASMGD